MMDYIHRYLYLMNKLEITASQMYTAIQILAVAILAKRALVVLRVKLLELATQKRNATNPMTMRLCAFR